MKKNLLFWLSILVGAGIAFTPIIYFEHIMPWSVVWFLLVGITHAALVPKIIRCPSCKIPLLPYSTILGFKFLNCAPASVPLKCKKCGCKIK